MSQITVIMHTNGSHPEYIGAAIRSVLDQTYKDFTLLINNSHAYNNIVLDKVYDNVRIINRPCKNFIEHMASSFKHINSPFWCVVDSDDFIMPNHLAQLMEGLKIIRSSETSGGVFNCIGTSMIMKTVKGKPQKLIRAGWVRFLYRWIDPEVIASLAKAYKREYGFDQAIDKLPIWNRKILPDSFAPTYMYRRKEVGHVSDRIRYLSAKRDVDRIPVIIPKPFRDDHAKFKNSVDALPKGAIADEQTS